MENIENLEEQDLIKNLIDTMYWRSMAWPSVSFDLDAEESPFPLHAGIGFARYCVIEIYNEPKQKAGFSSEMEYLAIGKTKNGYEICVGIGEQNFGKVYLHGWLHFEELFSQNEDGKCELCYEADVCGFKMISSSLEEFDKKLFCN
jgi:hypothetical protein